MILALAAKGRKTIAIIGLVLLYAQIVLPGYALAAHTGVDYRANNTMAAGRTIVPHTLIPAVKKPGVENRMKKLAAKRDIGGPGQPESGAFHTVNNTNMVDLFTGDFSYTIPLIDVGGYPLAIGYNSGVTMDQEASWVGLGWNLNPGAITRNMRGVPDDFNGTDSVIKMSSIKDNQTVGVTAGTNLEVVGLETFKGGLGGSVGVFRNTYRGWGMEFSVNASLNVGKNGKGPLTAGLSMTNNSQEGLTLSPSLSVTTSQKFAEDHNGYGGNLAIGAAYNSRTGMKALQLSEGLNRYKEFENNSHNGGDGSSHPVMSFAHPSFTPTITLPYTSSMFTVTLKVGGEISVVHPSIFVSGYMSRQFIAKKDQRRSIPAFGYLNYENGATDPAVLLDYNREKEIPFREDPKVHNIAIPSYTYDVFSITGEGTGGMFRAYRGDIGYVYDHSMRTRDESGRVSLDIGLGNAVHGGVDLNYVEAYTANGPWKLENPLASTIAFKKSDKLFEAAYFRNPGEKTVNTGSFYDAVGGDDVVAVELFQPASSSSVLSTTTNLLRYQNKTFTGNTVKLKKENAYRTSRDKRTQVISYLNAREAGIVGLTKYIENYKLNEYTLNNCDKVMPDETDVEVKGLKGEYFRGMNFDQPVFTRIDPEVCFKMTNGANFNINNGQPQQNWLWEKFSVRWTGRLKADITGPYTLITDTDDGVRLYLNGKLLIDRWYGQTSKPPGSYGSVAVNLVAGETYDIRLEYFQNTGRHDTRLYWEYPGHSMRIIPQDFLLPPTTKDVFEVGADKVISIEKRINGFRKENHISEVDVLNADGRRYVYGLPVYNLKQKEASFSVNTADGNPKDGLVKYTPDEDDSTTNRKGNDYYFNGEQVPAYAHSFLLTGIVSPDYVDLSGNGISDDDPGDAVKFNYTKVAGIDNPYGWRAPYTDSATYNEGLKTDNRDDKGNYVYGEKELWYLHSIESKNMIATFKLAGREDLLAIDRKGKKTAGPAKRLEEINLYTKADFMKYKTAAKPIKTVHFKYSYRLCRGINGAVNDSGKLTLDTIYFTYNGNEKAKRNPYIFNYHKNNPRYNGKSYDRWGNYKDPLDNPASTTQNIVTNAEYPYTLQDSTKAAWNVAAWTLDSIVQPSGGSIRVTYESDDYGYVQNKKATQMYPIAGFSSSKPLVMGDLKALLYSPIGLDETVDHLYVGVNVPKKVNSDPEVFSKYLQGLSSTYFKLFVQMPSDKWGAGSEYVPCYATIDLRGGYGSLNNGNTIWFKLKGIDNAGNEGPLSPLAKAAIQFLRLNLPSKAYPGSDVGDDMGIASAVKVLLGMADNIKNAFSSFDNSARTKGWVKLVDLTRSFVRLNNPTFKKYGGGLRVKRIVSYDHWNAMTKQTESVYGQEYQYTDTRIIDGVPESVSTGVATYEPLLGGEENPLRVPLQYQEQIAALAPVTLGYVEEPLGETFYPSPSVGYSKVRVRSIHTANTRSANGYEESCFFTSYDFPTITDRSNLYDQKKRYKPKLANFLRVDAKHFVAVSQGFKVELNDMHGKLKSKATYPENDPKNYIAYTENFYHVDNLSDKFKHLNNNVDVISPNGVVTKNVSVGKDVELMVDMRQQQSITNAYNVNLNTEMFIVGVIPWLVPSMLNLAQRDESKFRSVAVTKVISRHGIIDSVLAVDKGSRVSTANMLYDSETGDPVLTSTRNEFNDPIFNFTYPAAWAYDGMGGAYKNISFSLEHVFIKNGRITAGLSAGTESSYFAAGDELMIWSHQKTHGTDCAPDYATFPNGGKIWAIDANAMGGGDPDIYFMDANGTPFTGNDISLKVIRSGRRNIAAAVGTISMLDNPLKESGQLVIDNTSRIVNAAATEYKQFWKAADRKKASIVMNCIPEAYDIADCQVQTFVNDPMSQDFTPVCPDGGTAVPVTYTVPIGVYTSTISPEDANAKAQADIDANGQNYANAYGKCAIGNDEKSQSFNKQCTTGTGSAVIYKVAKDTYFSTISKEDANAKAQADIDANGQNYANEHGSCGPPCQIYVKGRTAADNIDALFPYAIQIKSSLTGEYYNTVKIPDGGLMTELPYCIAFDYMHNDALKVEIGSMEGIYAIVRNEEKYCGNNGASVWDILPGETITLSKTKRSVYQSPELTPKIRKSDCGEGLVGSLVMYTVPYGKYTSVISPEDAQAQAQAEVNQYGQSNADTKGVCVAPNAVYVKGVADDFTVRIISNDGLNTELIKKRFSDGGTPYNDVSLSPGIYIVEVSTRQQPINVKVNADQKSIGQGGLTTWTATLPIVIEVGAQ